MALQRRAAAKVPPQGAGKTLLSYLSGRFNYHSCEEWRNRILQGELSINEAVCTDPERILQAGEMLEYHPAQLIEPAVRKDYKIVYEDEFLLVIDKPGNLPVHPAGPYFAHTLWAFLKESGYENIHFVNRLDRETSGLMIAAKDGETAGKLSTTLPDMFKCYNTVVHGTFPESMTAEGYLITDTFSPIRKKQRFVSNNEVKNGFELPEKAVEVKTQFDLIKSNGKFSLVNAVLQTGRMHQIRATLCSLGYPVTGDKLYGVNEQFYRKLALDTLNADDRRELVLDHQALHCCEISFIHPVSEQKITLHSPVPEEFTQLTAPEAQSK